MLYFWQIRIFWKKILLLHVSINSTWYEKSHLKLLKILSSQKFWDIMRGFMRNHSQMQIKRITGLPLAVRGMSVFVFLEEISPQIFHLYLLSSIFQFPEIMAIEIITTWVSSWQNNPLWKTNKIMFKKFSLALSSRIWTNNFSFFVLHFLVSKMEYMILMLEGK